MINLVGRVDLAAATGTTVWHRASALTKLLLAAAIVGLAITTRSLPLQLTLHAMAWLLALSSRLPLRVIAIMVAYPLLFSGLFVLAGWTGDVVPAVRLLLRPTTACLAAAWLIGTTPYPDLFAPLSRLPRAARPTGCSSPIARCSSSRTAASGCGAALRVRGGVSGPLRRRLSVAGESLGTLVLYGFDRSARLYATMLLRGHAGRICGCRHYAETTRDDLWVALAGVLVIAAAIALWRMP